MFVSRETEGDLSEDGSSEHLFHRGSAPGPCGLSRLGGYIQSMRGKFVCRRADGNAAGLRLGPRCLSMGPTRPRLPSLPPTAALTLRPRSRARFWRGFPASSPVPYSRTSPTPDIYQRGLHPRTPGDFCTHKSHQKALRRSQTPFFSPIGRLQRNSAQPLRRCGAAGPS